MAEKSTGGSFAAGCAFASANEQTNIAKHKAVPDFMAFFPEFRVFDRPKRTHFACRANLDCFEMEDQCDLRRRRLVAQIAIVDVADRDRAAGDGAAEAAAEFQWHAGIQ